jgi:hypothetical protein
MDMHTDTDMDMDMDMDTDTDMDMYMDNVHWTWTGNYEISKQTWTWTQLPSNGFLVFPSRGRFGVTSLANGAVSVGVGTGVVVVIASGRMSFFSSHLFLTDDLKKLSLFLNFFHSITKVFVTLSMKGWGRTRTK